MSKNLRAVFGAGLEYSGEIAEDLVDRLTELELIEIIPENFFFNRHQWFLEALGDAGTPVIIHGIELSVGTAGPFRQEHFDQMRRVADQVNTIAMSDHICMTEAGGIKIGQLTTLPFTRECADYVCRNLATMARQVSVPIVMENIANQFYFSNTEMSETDFLNQIFDRTGTYMMMDLHNIFANSVNFNFDPYLWMKQIDLSRVWGVHLAGGYYDHGFLEDGHSSSVPEPVWEMFGWLLKRTNLSAAIVERTSDYPGLDIVLAEVQRARDLMEMVPRETTIVEQTEATL